MENFFKHDTVSWQKVSKRGKTKYLLSLGVIKLGLIVWFVYKFSKYLYEINYTFDSFKVGDFVKSYLIWTPLTILIGIIISHFLWNENEKKFKTG